MNELQIQFKKDVLALVGESNDIVITSHLSPDDDSIASVLSLYTIFSGLYPEKKIRIIYSSTPVLRYQIFKNFDKIEFVDDVTNVIPQPDLLIVADGSQLHRFSQFSEKLKLIPKIICIDHHASPEDGFTLSLVDTKVTSTADLIYRVFADENTLTKELAEIFMLGILGDTGTFNYIKPYQTEVFSIVQKLVEVGNISIDEFKSRYQSISPRVFMLIQELTKNTSFAEIASWPKMQYSYIDEKMVTAENYTEEELSSASHVYMYFYVRTLKDVPWGIVLTPRGNQSRVSARSLPGSVNVRNMFERMAIGGGHDRACGGGFKDTSIKDSIEKVISWMKENKPLIS